MEEWTLLLCGVPAKLFNQSELAEKRDHFQSWQGVPF